VLPLERAIRRPEELDDDRLAALIAATAVNDLLTADGEGGLPVCVAGHDLLSTCCFSGRAVRHRACDQSGWLDLFLTPRMRPCQVAFAL
jgi:hypothetical protein